MSEKVPRVVAPHRSAAGFPLVDGTAVAIHLGHRHVEVVRAEVRPA